MVKEYPPKSTSCELESNLMAYWPPEIKTNWLSSISIPEVDEPKNVDIYIINKIIQKTLITININILNLTHH